MSTILQNRKVPLLIAGGLFGGLLYGTYGGTQQPRPRQQAGAGGAASTGAPVSETLEAIAGTGGQRARDTQHIDYDVKDARLGTASPTAVSKRNPAKVRDDDLGGRDTTVGGGGQGKHIGERDPAKSGDLPWKKIGSDSSGSH